MAEANGDYWEKFFGIFYSQKRGKIHITTQRIIFMGGWVTNIELDLKNIVK